MPRAMSSRLVHRVVIRAAEFWILWSLWIRSLLTITVIQSWQNERSDQHTCSFSCEEPAYGPNVSQVIVTCFWDGSNICLSTVSPESIYTPIFLTQAATLMSVTYMNTRYINQISFFWLVRQLWLLFYDHWALICTHPWLDLAGTWLYIQNLTAVNRFESTI